MTGDVIDEGYFLFNLNDLINSLIYFFNINMGGGYLGLVHQMQILQKSSDDAGWKMLIIKLWSYSFLIVMEMAILNILITFIGSILGLYEELHAAEKEAEAMQVKK